jgi:hypothetical protein
MRIPRFVFLLAVLTFAQSALAQQATTSAPQATALLQQALAALTGGNSISDVTLMGTVQSIAGSDNESGTFVAKALVGTGSLMNLTLPSGSRSEVRNISAQPVVGTWSGPDGVSHAATYPNLLTDPGWFPAFTIASLLSGQNAIITYVGPETYNGQSVIHVSASQQFPSIPGDTGTLMQHFTQMDVYLDPTTSLPAVIAFNIHADSNALLDIPVQIRFSGYQAVTGAQIPFHIQKFINNGLALDLQLTSVTLNSGLSAAIFGVQ